MSRESNILVFEDTMRMLQMDAALRAAVESSLSAQTLICETDQLANHSGSARFQNPAKVVVSSKRSFEAAEPYCTSGKKVCVHNFASASNPGGGVTRGAGAQEECLCRCSTLYPCLDSKKMWQGFYLPHRREGNPLHNDDCIYTPGVVVFKSDTSAPKLMPREKWYTVDILTCAAPNLRERPSNAYNPADGNQVKIDEVSLLALHEQRLKRMLDAACEHGAEVLILGAFGCGAFQNPPEIVAEAAKRILPEYRHCFEVVEFAVYCRPGDNRNFQAFHDSVG